MRGMIKADQRSKRHNLSRGVWQQMPISGQCYVILTVGHLVIKIALELTPFLAPDLIHFIKWPNGLV